MSDPLLEPFPMEGGDEVGGTAATSRAAGDARPEDPAGDGAGDSSTGDDRDSRPLEFLERLLRDEPTSFGFFQAVRVLRRLRPERRGVGLFVNPEDEVVRFSVNSGIGFPPSEIRALELPEEGRARMSVNFLGLTGPQGVLPHHYSLLAGERARARDGSMGDFFDLFHHRMLSLFYRAWEKYRFAVACERGEEDALAVHLRDLVGLGAEPVGEAPPVASVPLYHAGLLALQPRGAQALEQLLEELLEVPVEVEQFVGRWYPLDRHDQCALGDEEDPSNRLGTGAVVGDEIWDAQTAVRVRLGPLSRPQYQRFLPGGEQYERVRELTRFFSHDQFDFELQLVLGRDQVPPLVLGSDQEGAQPLGWCTWIRTREPGRDADETVFEL